MNFISKSSEQTFELGEKIGSLLEAGMVIALEGDLGGGKTTFTKGIAKGLGIREEITSPSFTLGKIYQILIKPATNDKRPTTLYHFDFYRIDNPKDIVSYELVEALEDPSGVVVVEWAEKIEINLPKEKLVVRFLYKGENEREIILMANDKKHRSLLTN